MKKILSFIFSGIIYAADTSTPPTAKSCEKNTDCDTAKGEKCIDGACFVPLDLILYRPAEAKEVSKLPDVTQENLFRTVFKTILGASMILTIAAIVVAAVFYIISRGNEEEITKAKNIIIYLVVGLVIMAAAYGFVSGVIQFDFFKANP